MSAGYVELEESSTAPIVALDVDVDADDIYQDATDRIADTIEGWVPREGHLEVAVLQEQARIAALVAAVAGQVPAAIFRAFATGVVGLTVSDGAEATVAATVTAVDSAGYTVPAGMVVAFAPTGDTLVEFQVAEASTIAPGTTSVAVTLEALEPGSAYNGYGPGEMVPVDLHSWVESVEATGTSSGGIDADTDVEALDRLAAELRLLGGGLVLPADYAVTARKVDGVHRAVAIDGYDPGVNEVQSVTVTGASGGTFTLTYSGQTTSGIAHDADAAAVQNALEALSNIAVGDVAVSGGPLGTAAVLVEFTGDLASTDVAEMTADDTLLTGGGAEAAAVATTTAGVAASTGNERTVSVAAVDEDGLAVSEAVKGDVQALLEAGREVNFVIHVIDPTYTTVDVAFQIVVDSTADAPAVLEAAETAVEEFLSPAYWAGGALSPPAWTEDVTVRFNDVMGVLYAVAGVASVTSLTLNSGTANVTLTGPAALPDPASTVAGTAV